MSNVSQDILREKQARINKDETMVKPYTLPFSPLDDAASPEEFAAVRKNVLKLFETRMYGVIPPAPEEIAFDITSENIVFNGLAIRREIDIVCRNAGQTRVLHLLLHIPRNPSGAVPCFFGLNFCGNSGTSADTGIAEHPFDRTPYEKFVDCDPANMHRGIQAHRFDYENILAAGFASATIWYFDLFPDHAEGFAGSIMPLFYSAEQWHAARPSGALSAWAWGIMRAVDCLRSQPELDPERIFVHGHSRLGKAALWAGANDERIALTASNCSGCCGAKLTHRYFGENLEWLLHFRSYWFAPAFQEYICRDTEVPFDQHLLMGCCAPRALYVASADADINADPRGEFLATTYASRYWKIFGFPPLSSTADLPPANSGISAPRIRYFIRSGRHDITPLNWQDMTAFAATL